MREFGLEELTQYDGKDGKPVYIVYNGRVIDVSQSKLWKGGLHMKRHHAGQDLTVDIGGAPHGLETLDRYPQVGVLRAEPAEGPVLPGFLVDLLRRFPMLRRHPHPMTVHFPIVFMLSTTMFTLLYLLTGVKSFETTALHCLGAGILFMPAVVGTGFLTWWLNYLARPVRAVKIKWITSGFLFLTALFAFVWRLSRPGLLESFGGASALYVLLILLLAPMVMVIGWFGASLTFPVEKE
jgi:predicted heme/steroid binding protein/uncharacterized membrane protein